MILRLSLAVLLALLLAVPAPLWAAIGSTPTMQVVCNVASSTSPTCTLTGTTTAGRLLVAAVAIRTTQTDTGLSDPTHGAWTCPAGANHSDGSEKTMICYLENITSVTNLVMTLALGGSSVTYWNITEWSGVMTSSAEDGVQEGTDTTSPFGTASALTTTTAGLLVSAHIGNAVATCGAPASGFTALTNNGARDCFSYRVGSATSSDAAYGITGPTSVATALAAWKEAASAAVGSGGMAMIGVGK